MKQEGERGGGVGNLGWMAGLGDGAYTSCTDSKLLPFASVVVRNIWSA